jgi:N-acetylglucosaminyl-diphospho-decaprenol L-rhamnosyltransferase
MTRPDVDVVVPVHGGWEHVAPCLESLRRQSVPVRVIVVDDRSPDDTADRIAARFPEVELLRNPVNVGFAASCNRGIAHGSAPVVLLLNSDVVAEPRLAEAVADALSADDSVGSAAPILLDPAGRIDSFGVMADATLAGFVRFHGAPLDRADASRPVLLGPYGAAAGYRRVALDAVGPLDENIFMYGEELDLALRLRAGGWGTAAIAVPLGVHVGGATSGNGSKSQRYLAGVSRGYLLRVYGVLRTRHAIRALVTEALVAVAGVLRDHDTAAFRGRRDGWRRARGVARRPIPASGYDAAIGFAQSLRLRGAGHWTD